MKPTKKKTAKRKYTDIQEKFIGKLLDLKYRINDSYRGGKRSEAAYNDKTWVVDRLDDVRNGEILSKGELLHANNLWKQYQESRMNNWESSRD